jgi:hypothetical protein
MPSTGMVNLLRAVRQPHLSMDASADAWGLPGAAAAGALVLGAAGAGAAAVGRAGNGWLFTAALNLAMSALSFSGLASCSLQAEHEWSRGFQGRSQSTIHAFPPVPQFPHACTRPRPAVQQYSGHVAAAAGAAVLQHAPPMLGHASRVSHAPEEQGARCVRGEVQLVAPGVAGNLRGRR